MGTEPLPGGHGGGFPAPRESVPPEPPPSPVVPGWYRLGDRAATAEREAAGPTPLVEADPQGDPGHRAVTFLYHDRAASAVILSANGLLDHRDPAAMEFEAVRPGLWALTLRMPADWEAAYRITAHTGPGEPPWRAVGADRRTVRLAADAGGVDPLNPAVGAGMSGAAQSLLRLPLAPDAPWLAAATPLVPSRLDPRGAPDTVATGLPSVMGLGAGALGHGRPQELLELTVRDSGAGRDRLVWLYLPRPERERSGRTGAARRARRGKPLPLVLLHDGQVWARYLNLKSTLDAAVAAGVLPPLAVAMIDSLDVPTRTRELPGPTGTVDFVARDLLPLLRARFPVTGDPRRTVACGASYGGLAALWQLVRYPELVGAALAQSPSLWRYDLTDFLLPLTGRVRVRLQAGRYESTIHRPTVALAQALAEAGADVGFRSVTGGHDWAWWHPWLVHGVAELLTGT